LYDAWDVDGRKILDTGDTATETAAGIVELATQAEVDAGTDTSRAVTPKRLRDRTYAAWAQAGGRLGGVSVGAGGLTRTAVTFPGSRFTVTPLVTVSQIGSDYRDITCGADGVSTTGMSVWRGSAYNPGVSRDGVIAEWTATQMTATSATG
jgi:hypothetical protein